MDLTEHAVRSRIASLTSFSQASDFVLDPGRPVGRSRMFDPDVSPYCFDLEARELYCVSTPDISGATFFYQAQRQHARSVIKVPFEALPEPVASPTLIFSIGRCGSTLLHKAFEAAGVRTVSEPDYFTQAALHRSADDALRSAIGRATQLLPYQVIKLRAECNNAPLLIAGGFRAPSVMFVLRAAIDWADSARRVSSHPMPSGIAALLHALVGGLDALTRYYPVRVCYYEDFRDLSPDYVNTLLAWMGSDARLGTAAAAELARRDAQEGSIMSRASVGDAADDPAFREAFRKEWDKVRPVALIERLGLRGL
ncbi:MAG TPA: hypothetical protein VMM27_08635 [Casimicrobiaceae bacterium]|nr:hypothetical protein [Casimicrobiaceae bacterium]